ncbi:MAG TPA: hypothetical protein VJ689_08350, partial [Gaiellaceae bacterium]|jgi:hypothetical protein|nr:hypothetical protein [Gaiellaceae bacterium]
MRGLTIAGVVCGIVLLPLALLPATVAGATKVSTSEVAKRFRQQTGERLVVNRRSSFPGHYVALDLGASSIAKKARYGTFTIYVVTAADTDAQVTDLLADGHTGELGTPGPGSIYWEAGSTLRGEKYWLAKRRYGANVVLWWIGASAAQRTDAAFRRLHGPLTAVTR